MELRLSKQAKKYLDSVDENTRRKLLKALDKLSRLEGNIVPLKGEKDRYRYKIEHCRITLDWGKEQIVIAVIEISTRSNIKY